MLNRFGAWSAVALLAALVLVGCGKTTKKEENPPTVTMVNVTYVVPTAGPATPSTAPSEGGSATTAATQPAGGAQVVDLDLEDIKFSTDAFEIPANTDVTIHITNKGATAHDFSIDALNISTGDVAPGATIDVKINAKPGDYVYYCNVPGHEAAGMKGTMTVKEGAATAPGAETSPAASSPAASAAAAVESPVASPAAASSPVASPAGAASSAATQPAGGAQTVNLEMVDIAFKPTTLEIPANTDSVIHITNTGSTAHDFSIDKLNITTGDVAPGASIDVKINAPAGTYDFYCNVPGHEAAGMKGTLTVTAGAAPAPGAASSPASAAASPAASPVASPAVASSPATAQSSAGSAQPIQLEMVDIAFKPTTLEIPANTDTTIHITNTGSTAHDFSIDKLNITTGDVAPGASIDVKINAPAGEYTYYCNVPGHEAAGMKGTLTVK